MNIFNKQLLRKLKSLPERIIDEISKSLSAETSPSCFNLFIQENYLMNDMILLNKTSALL